MKKLKTVIQYECTTSFKYIGFFYAIQYGIISIISAIIALSIGNLEKAGVNGLELNSIIYVGILGVLGFKEDFKMLIQNGFTRRYIFFATISLFTFMSGIMSFIDTIVNNTLHHILHDYSSLFGSIYGYDNVFANWIWLFLFYMFVCCLLYLGILVINKIGKTLSIYLGVLLGGFVLLIAALFRFVLPNGLVNDLAEMAMKVTGFMKNGTINFIYPIFTLFVLVSALGIASYNIIRRTELK